MLRRARRVACFVALSSSAAMLGCASTPDKVQTPVAAAATAPVVGRLQDPAFDGNGLTRRDLDLNHDGKVDALQFTKVVGNDVRVVRKEVDINFDGRIDLVRNLDDAGELVSELLDTDFDQRIDVEILFEKGVITTKRYDTNFDGKPDLWRTFEKGAIAKEEADLNHDDKVDYWEYYEGGQLDRVGIDRDADGQVDEWQTRESAGADK